MVCAWLCAAADNRPLRLAKLDGCARRQPQPGRPRHWKQPGFLLPAQERVSGSSSDYEWRRGTESDASSVVSGLKMFDFTDESSTAPSLPGPATPTSLLTFLLTMLHGSARKMPAANCSQ